MFENNNMIHVIYVKDSNSEQYRQKYQDAMDEVQRLNRVIDELKEKLQSTEKERHLMELANGFLAEMVDNLTDEVNALYVKLHDFNN